MRIWFHLTRSGLWMGRRCISQIIRYIKRGAVAGTIRDGDELPSRRVLSALLGINPNTVQKAFHLLEEEQLIEIAHGREKLHDAAGKNARGAAAGAFVRGTAQRGADAAADGHHEGRRAAPARAGVGGRKRHEKAAFGICAARAGRDRAAGAGAAGDAGAGRGGLRPVRPARVPGFAHGQRAGHGAAGNLFAGAGRLPAAARQLLRRGAAGMATRCGGCRSRRRGCCSGAACAMRSALRACGACS